MGDHLGRVSNFVLGNTNGRFLGRRMHRSSFQDMRAQLASPRAWSNPLDRAREMSTWATIVYQMRFGTTPQDQSTYIPGWTLINESDPNHPADFDALTYEAGGRVVITLEGTTSGREWMLNLATGAYGNDTQMQAAFDYGRQLANGGAIDGQSIDLTGQSLGAGLMPLVAAGILDVDPTANINSLTGFSTPQFDAQIRGFLASRLDQTEIDHLFNVTENYVFSGDAIILPWAGSVLEIRILSGACSTKISRR